MTIPEITFVAGATQSARDAVRSLEQAFRTRREGRSRARRSYYDTFDWRLHRDGGTLSTESADRISWLRWLKEDGSTRQRLPTKEVPAFAWDLEVETFRNDLGRVIEMRRLLLVAHVDVQGETLAILDRREKTVARVHVEHGTATAGEGATNARSMVERLRVAPVRGYVRPRDAVVRHLEQTLGLRRQEGGEFGLALETLGLHPGSYSSKLDVALAPRARADEAVRKILSTLLATMRANEDGTRRSLDSEFLHDFRVAVRRSRSCLGQVKEVLAPDDTERFRRDLAWLSDETGRARDLDVYRLNLRAYRLELPDSTLRGIRAGLVELSRPPGRGRRARARRRRAAGPRGGRETDPARLPAGAAAGPPSRPPHAGGGRAPAAHLLQEAALPARVLP